jgi:hypothetical protein
LLRRRWSRRLSNRALVRGLQNEHDNELGHRDQ